VSCKFRRAGTALFLVAVLWTVASARARPPADATFAPSQTGGVSSLSRPVLDLQRDVDRIIAAGELERAFWGIRIQSLAANDVLYSINADKLMIPASTLKVVTLAAAAERLGWDFSYETRIVADGVVNGGTLDGNLVIVGSGDPSVDQPALDAWVASVKSAGITKITGRVLGDARAFSGEGLGFGWSWDDLAYYYAAPIAAVQFRENAVDLTLRPASSPGAPPLYELSPGSSGLEIVNRMTTGASTAAPEFVARRAAGSNVAVLEGIVPAGSRPVVHPLSVPDPVRFLAAAFSEALVAGGVEIGGPPPPDPNIVRSRDVSAARLLAAHRSASLRMLARRLIEVSQNQYAETLLKTIGAQAGDATSAGGVKVEEAVLASWGIPSSALVLRDGSGLSRYDAVTPSALVQVLSHMYRDPVHAEAFLSTLNVAGVSGTVAARMKNTPAGGKARVKDGSMSGVRAICGVVETRDGEPMVFAILANNFSIAGATVTGAIDAIVARVADFRR
jgi:D-alanyl-D-alanine carboxypeptidase/D-alanyl-D-alanine-endopeptidase (penicillin-binding protein 4)